MACGFNNPEEVCAVFFVFNRLVLHFFVQN